MKRRKARAHITNQPTDRLKHTRVHGRTRKNREHNQAQLEKADNGTKDIDETCTSTLCHTLLCSVCSVYGPSIVNRCSVTTSQTKNARARAPQKSQHCENARTRENPTLSTCVPVSICTCTFPSGASQ